jgi:putative flippase GtrA
MMRIRPSPFSPRRLLDPDQSGPHQSGWEGAVLLGRRLVRIAKFGIVGVANTLIDVGIYAVLSGALGVHPIVANTMSYSTGMCSSFFLNRGWTFRDRDASRTGRQFIYFFATNVFTLLVCNTVMAAALHVAPEALVKLMVVLLSFPLNYAMTAAFVFRK